MIQLAHEDDRAPVKKIFYVAPNYMIVILIGMTVYFGFLTTEHHVINNVLLPQFTSVKVSKALPTQVAVKPIAVPQFDKTQYSTSDPTSIWVIVNKSHPLQPLDYAPIDLVRAHGGMVSSWMLDDLNAMLAAANNDGVYLTITSSYRSYSYQVSLYSQYVADNGQAATDTFSARPGYSEHQTGLAIDFGSSTGPTCNLNGCYAATVEGEWLATHASEYGFLLRYTVDKQSITGYESEPWHYRYIGQVLAKEMATKSISTLEEFFGVSGGQTYEP